MLSLFCLFSVSTGLRLGFRGDDQFVVARTRQAAKLVIEIDAGPGIRGSVHTLAVGQHVGLPVGEALALTNLLMEQVGVEFLERHVLDTYATHLVL